MVVKVRLENGRETWLDPSNPETIKAVENQYGSKVVLIDGKAYNKATYGKATKKAEHGAKVGENGGFVKDEQGNYKNSKGFELINQFDGTYQVLDKNGMDISGEYETLQQAKQTIKDFELFENQDQTMKTGGRFDKVKQMALLTMKPFAYKQKAQFLKENPEMFAGKVFDNGGEVEKWIGSYKKPIKTSDVSKFLNSTKNDGHKYSLWNKDVGVTYAYNGKLYANNGQKLPNGTILDFNKVMTYWETKNAKTLLVEDEKLVVLPEKQDKYNCYTTGYDGLKNKYGNEDNITLQEAVEFCWEYNDVRKKYATKEDLEKEINSTPYGKDNVIASQGNITGVVVYKLANKQYANGGGVGMTKGVIKDSKLIFSGGRSHGYKDVFYILYEKWAELEDKGFLEPMDRYKETKDWRVAYKSKDGTHWGVETSPYSERYMYSPSLDLLRKQNEGEWYANGSDSDFFKNGGLTMKTGGVTNEPRYNLVEKNPHATKVSATPDMYSNLTKQGVIDLSNTMSYYERMDNDELEITTFEKAKKFIELEGDWKVVKIAKHGTGTETSEVRFLSKDHSGRGERPYILNESHIRKTWDLKEIGDDDETSLGDFLNNSEPGDKWQSGTESLENLGIGMALGGYTLTKYTKEQEKLLKELDKKFRTEEPGSKERMNILQEIHNVQRMEHGGSVEYSDEATENADEGKYIFKDTEKAMLKNAFLFLKNATQTDDYFVIELSHDGHEYMVDWFALDGTDEGSVGYFKHYDNALKKFNAIREYIKSNWNIVAEKIDVPYEKNESNGEVRYDAPDVMELIGKASKGFKFQPWLYGKRGVKADNFPKVQYKGDSRAFYYVVGEVGNDYILVFEEKLDHWKNAKNKIERREFYEEIDAKDNFEPYKSTPQAKQGSKTGSLESWYGNKFNASKGAKFGVPKKYTHFAVSKSTGKIMSGWETISDIESLKYYAKSDLKDMDLNPNDYKILSKAHLLRMGVDPFNWDNWQKNEPTQAKRGAKTDNSVQLIEYKGEEIMFEPINKEYFVNDNQFKTLAEAKKYIDSGSPLSDAQINLYRHGAMKQGGKLKPYADLSRKEPMVIKDDLFDTFTPEKPTLIKEKKSKKDTGTLTNIIPQVELVRMGVQTLENIGDRKITDSKSATKILYKVFPKNQIGVQEFYYALYTDRANNVIAYYNLSKGGVSGTIADAELVGSVGIKLLAQGVLVAHNHPSGNLKPSEADIKMALHTKQVLKGLGIELLDSIIIVPGGEPVDKFEGYKYTSLQDEGKI